MSTTAANAALGPLAGRYLSRLESTLREVGMRVPVLMMTCAGGVLPTAVLSDRPAFALFSGPAAGVMGSQAIGEQIGLKNLLTTDIGGTSFDVGVVADGKPIMRSEIALAGADIRVHSIDVDSIGAGGGSIAQVQFGELRVGPRSAGANPGPACYGRGGLEPTATDADLVLGVLDPENFLGGRMKLDIEAARRAIADHVAKPLGMSVTEAAWGIREVLDSRMADLLRRMTIERGYDPRDFALFANGGAGPSHAWVLSEELGLDSFIVPAAATAVSAFGTGNSDLGFTAESPGYVRVRPGGVPAAEQLAKISAGHRSVDCGGGAQEPRACRGDGQCAHRAADVDTLSRPDPPSGRFAGRRFIRPRCVPSNDRPLRGAIRDPVRAWRGVFQGWLRNSFGARGGLGRLAAAGAGDQGRAACLRRHAQSGIPRSERAGRDGHLQDHFSRIRCGCRWTVHHRIPGTERRGAAARARYRRRLRQFARQHAGDAMKNDPGLTPITFEVIRNRLVAITEEMRIALQSVSGSPTVTEASDFSPGCSSPTGRSHRWDSRSRSRRRFPAP